MANRETVNVVAPREQQPVQSGEWTGHTSAKFTTNKAHIQGPVINHDQAHPMFSMGGRQHFDSKNDAQKQWKASLKTGIDPPQKDSRREGVKHITFKPDPTKGQPERRHKDPDFKSMQGPTFDHPKEGLRPFEYANQKSKSEYSQETVMTQK